MYTVDLHVLTSDIPTDVQSRGNLFIRDFIYVSWTGWLEIAGNKTAIFLTARRRCANRGMWTVECDKLEEISQTSLMRWVCVFRYVYVGPGVLSSRLGRLDMPVCWRLHVLFSLIATFILCSLFMAKCMPCSGELTAAMKRFFLPQPAKYWVPE